MRRSLLPVLLMVVGLAMLIGCLYVPTFEQPELQGPPDFRSLVGDDAPRPIRPGYVDRRTVVLILGPPSLKSDDGKAIGYLFATHHGYWVWPLCFAGQAASHTEYGLRLDFRDDDVLRSFKVASAEENSDPLFFSRSGSIDNVVSQLNQSEPNQLHKDYWRHPISFGVPDLSSRPRPTTASTKPRVGQ